MEYLVVIIAAMLAGIGTGLVGLSAAMVELHSKHGLDTITVPIAASLVLSIASLF